MEKASILLDAIHLGEILLDKFMTPRNLSIDQLAHDLHVPPKRIHAIVRGKRSITADTALLLATYFRTSPETWLSLQSEYDLRLAGRAAG